MTNRIGDTGLEWFRALLLQDILPKWWGAATEQGLFLPHFDRQWRPQARNYGTLVSQCRLLYNFSQGYTLTQDPAYREAVENGAAFLLQHFRDQQHGGWFWSCDLDGAVLDDHKNSYGHAFAIFGLAHAYQCSPDSALREAMLHTWEIFTTRFQDSHSGIAWRMTRAFEPADDTKSQNPVMHLFEALLAASEVEGAESLLAEARRVGDFVLERLVRKADRRLPEVYDLTWRELTESPGRLDIGHAFEWAFLTSWAVERGFPAHYLDYGNSFLLYGLAIGLNWERGGIYSPSSPEGVLHNRKQGWWEQCEAIRALAHYAIHRQRDDLRAPLDLMANFARTSFVDAEYGGWYPGLEADGAPITTHKGNEWKVDYHVVGMCVEVMRLLDQG
jgi:mannose/cellobiose epimerase-like protein (N-acyl-D-glucosamine 2-epimerase family)